MTYKFGTILEMIDCINQLIEKGHVKVEELYSDSIAVFVQRKGRGQPNYKLYID